MYTHIYICVRGVASVILFRVSQFVHMYIHIYAKQCMQGCFGATSLHSQHVDKNIVDCQISTLEMSTVKMLTMPNCQRIDCQNVNCQNVDFVKMLTITKT
jgi:hypothetical protein